MMLGTVSGTVAATIRSGSLSGQALVTVSIATGSGERTVVACNPLSAGLGERVLLARGAAARHALGLPDSAVDAAVVAIVDEKASAPKS
ncbi:ethanolamine utilization protein EutN [Gordonia sp. X0973]|uniref:EutN/CcmL family microcompartment protein n=1 Tax=Gordonia sp. X0973 TaxID=2742602 RepID=UPI000F521893|nr:EutN/CcmL family microcompartment protein [Gordonia sp. X0973]QKT08258.1 ethanolamine utilization protein EutN [Gordonia sp. X0973]